MRLRSQVKCSADFCETCLSVTLFPELLLTNSLKIGRNRLQQGELYYTFLFITHTFHRKLTFLPTLHLVVHYSRSNLLLKDKVYF